MMVVPRVRRVEQLCVRRLERKSGSMVDEYAGRAKERCWKEQYEKRAALDGSEQSRPAPERLEAYRRGRRASTSTNPTTLLRRHGLPQMQNTPWRLGSGTSRCHDDVQHGHSVHWRGAKRRELMQRLFSRRIEEVRLGPMAKDLVPHQQINEATSRWAGGPQASLSS